MVDKNKILVVDDNTAFIDMIVGIFGVDYNVDIAFNGQEGFEKAKLNVPDLILLDVNMPGMTGIEFARKLAACRETAQVPIIVITASDYNSLTESLLRTEHNVKVFMTKLSPVDTIKEKVLAVINKEIL